MVETAYISNKEEEKLLKSNNFQKKIALAVASSVVEFISGTASIAQASDAVEASDKTTNQKEKGTPEKVNERNEITTNHYEVKRGDTLFSIARLFNTKVAVLLKLNDRKIEEDLFAGQKILVPVNKNVQSDNAKNGASINAGKVNDVKAASRIYIVKKGDTLFSLAKNNSLTIAELRSLNHMNMKDSDSLLLGQKIRLP